LRDLRGLKKMAAGEKSLAAIIFHAWASSTRFEAGIRCVEDKQRSLIEPWQYVPPQYYDGVTMPKMRVAQVARPKGPIEIVEREIPEPGAGEVRIKVQACGICHSDSFTKEGLMPGIQYPRVPGHEVAGLVDALGPSVPRWTVGQR